MKFQEAITRLNELAKEFQDKNPNMSYQQAVSKALAENPNEAKAYLFKDAPNEKKVYAKIDEAKKDLYPTITPINSFRVVFNSYFGTNYPLLEDQSYYAFSLEKRRCLL